MNKEKEEGRYKFMEETKVSLMFNIVFVFLLYSEDLGAKGKSILEWVLT
jgi:hypothetical protein